jgi:Cys-rich four helix bundle protein (predicted Tat secretion target)
MNKKGIAMTQSVDAGEPAQATGLVTRRSMLATGLAVSSGIALAASGALAHDEKEHEHHEEHEDHKGHEEHEKHAHGPAPHQALIDAALDYINRGEVCIDHCITLLGKGDTSLIGCLRSVSAMMPLCTALVRLAALDAKRLKELAKVCVDELADCEEECKKHEDHHAVCKACAEACAACAEECKKLT